MTETKIYGLKKLSLSKIRIILSDFYFHRNNDEYIKQQTKQYN